MDPTAILTLARSSLTETAGRVADVVRLAPDSGIQLPASEWTIREAAAHLVTLTGIYTDIATGTPASIGDFALDTVTRRNAERIADISETEPEKLAALVADATGRFVEVTAERPGDQELPYLASGVRLDLASIACILLGELLIHGYDIARAVGHPWPIDPGVAQLVLAGYAPVFGLVANPETSAGVDAAFGVELRGGASFIVRFVDGEYRLEPPGSGPVDATISADPVAFLLVATGRMSRWEAIALGLLDAAGEHPDLALGFMDLFLYP